MHATRYEAHAFHDSLDRGRASGELSVEPGGFRFASGTHRVQMPFAGAQLRLGGANDRLVFISHPACPGWSVYTSDLSILRDPRLAGHPELTRALLRLRRTRLAGWVILAAVVAAIVAVPLVLVLNFDALAGVAARRIPPEWERALGESAYAQYEIKARVMEEAQAEPLLAPLVAPLTAALEAPRHDFRFHIARDASLNAFALPGGVIVIHSQLILGAESAEELLGVLAHEIAHVTEQHGLRNVISSAGILLVAQALIGDVGGLLGTVAAATPVLLSMRYSRGFEREADELGVALLDRADVDARGMVRFFARIKAEEEKVRARLRERAGENTVAALDQLGEFLSSHPATDARIAHIEALAARQSGPTRDLSREFAALKEAVQRFASEAPAAEDEPPGEMLHGHTH